MKVPKFELSFYAAAGDPETAVIDLFSSIGEYEGEGTSAETFRSFVSNSTAKRIKVHINSYGGSAFAGIAMASTLREASRSGKRVIAEVHGIAASAASIVATGADEIRMQSNAFMMIHNAWSMTVGPAVDHEASASTLRKLDEAIADTYAAATALRSKARTRDTILADMQGEKWFTAQEAVDYGLADKVVPLTSAAAYASRPDLSMFRNVPAALRSNAPSASVLHNGKDFGQLTLMQKHDLYIHNRSKYEAMKASAEKSA
jgi:ATP-dependent Clp protease protease subunit